MNKRGSRGSNATVTERKGGNSTGREAPGDVQQQSSNQQPSTAQTQGDGDDQG